MRAREWGAVGALVAILVVTAAWWSLALWPLPAETPYWIIRARVVCFGATRSGLPEAAGWLSLIGQPVMMLGLLVILWGDALWDGLRALAARRVGRGALAAAGVVLLAAAGAASARVARAARVETVTAPGAVDLPATYPRLDRQAPDFRLVDQAGDTVSLARFRGRPVLVTFAYAHCETVCPIAVHEVLRARDRLADIAPAVVVFTLDPWRDTPARLAHIAATWRLPERAFVLSGPAPAVESVLDRWNVARSRDPRTGEVAHPALVYVIDGRGRIAYVVAANASAIAQLARRL